MERYVEDFIKNAGGIDVESPELTVRDRLVYAKDQVVSTFKKVFPYILIGVGIGAVIHNWIPESVVEAVLGGNNPFGVVLATLIGVPMYADIFGTIPIAEALLGKGAQLGTVLSFMNDDGKAEAYKEPEENEKEAVQEAIDGCPVSAISWES